MAHQFRIPRRVRHTLNRPNSAASPSRQNRITQRLAPDELGVYE